MSALRDVIGMLKRDKRKLGAMLLLLAMALLLWGRLLLKQVPRTAVAEPQAAEESQSVSELLAQAPPPAPVRPRVHVDLANRLERDLFHLDRTAYQAAEESPAVSAAQAKLEAPTTDERLRLEAVVRAAASELDLQSTIVGDEPRAVINGKLLRPGENIDGFELREVQARRVILENQGVRVQLHM